MTEKDNDIEILMDALGTGTRINCAQNILHVMQDHNPDLDRVEGIFAMLVGVIGAVPQEVHDNFSAPLQELSKQWGDYLDSLEKYAVGRGAPYQLSPELTRIQKTLSYMVLKEAFDKSDVTDRAEMIHHSWTIPYELGRAERIAPYFGPSNCLPLDIAYDELIVQLQMRHNDLQTRIQYSTGPQPKPPQP